MRFQFRIPQHFSPPTLAALWLLWLLIPTSGASYILTDLGTLGGDGAYAYGLNNAGVIVGASLRTGNLPEQAFRYQNGVMTGLGTLLGSERSRAFNINSEGTILGETYIPEFVSLHQAFVYRDGVATPLGTLGGLESVASDINDQGWIVGSADVESYPSPHAFLYRNGAMTNLGTLGGDSSEAYALNENGVIVGYAKNAAGLIRAFRFDGTIHDLGTFGGNSSRANGINESGVIVGSAETTEEFVHHAFRDDGTMHDLGTLGGKSSFALAINAAAQLWALHSRRPMKAGGRFVYNGTMQDLNTLIAPGSGLVLTDAFAINDDGQIVGTGTAANGWIRAYLLTPALPVNYTVNGNGSITISSTGLLEEALSASGPYLDLGATNITVNPAQQTGDRFYRGRNESQ